MTGILSLLSHLRAPVIYGVVFLLVYGETAALIGMVLPGETAATVAGVLAGQQQISLRLAIPVVVVAAISGDSTGYLLGRRFGPGILEGRLFRGRLLSRRRARLEAATERLRQHGLVVVVASRFVPFLRTFTPSVAGAAQMPYLRFLGASIAGCVGWGVTFPVVGYLAAGSYDRVAAAIGNGGLIVLVLVIAIGVTVQVVGRHRDAAKTPAADAKQAADDPTLDGPAPDGPAHDSPALDSPAPDDPTLDGPAHDSPTLDSPALDDPAARGGAPQGGIHRGVA